VVLGGGRLLRKVPLYPCDGARRAEASDDFRLAPCALPTRATTLSPSVQGYLAPKKQRPTRTLQ